MRHSLGLGVALLVVWPATFDSAASASSPDPVTECVGTFTRLVSLAFDEMLAGRDPSSILVDEWGLETVGFQAAQQTLNELFSVRNRDGLAAALTRLDEVAAAFCNSPEYQTAIIAGSSNNAVITTELTVCEARFFNAVAEYVDAEFQSDVLINSWGTASPVYQLAVQVAADVLRERFNAGVTAAAQLLTNRAHEVCLDPVMEAEILNLPAPTAPAPPPLPAPTATAPPPVSPEERGPAPWSESVDRAAVAEIADAIADDDRFVDCAVPVVTLDGFELDEANVFEATDDDAVWDLPYRTVDGQYVSVRIRPETAEDEVGDPLFVWEFDDGSTATGQTFDYFFVDIDLAGSDCSWTLEVYDRCHEGCDLPGGVDPNANQAFVEEATMSLRRFNAGEGAA